MTPENLTKLTFDILTLPLLLFALALVTWYGIPWSTVGQDEPHLEPTTQPGEEPADWVEGDEEWASMYGRWW